MVLGVADQSDLCIIGTISRRDHLDLFGPTIVRCIVAMGLDTDTNARKDALDHVQSFIIREWVSEYPRLFGRAYQDEDAIGVLESL